MKNVLIILVLLSGLAVSEAAAQSCKPANCAPCPPGCCIFSCCTSKSASVASGNEQTVDVAFAAFIAEGIKSSEVGKPMSRKEMKSCIAACKSAAAKADSPVCQPAPSCKPGVSWLPNSVAVVNPAVQTASVKPKS